MQNEKLKKLKEIVDLQAEDDLLWSIPEYGKQSISEAYLQQELRRLHLIIESNNIDEINGLIEDYTNNCPFSEANDEQVD